MFEKPRKIERLSLSHVPINDAWLLTLGLLVNSDLERASFVGLGISDKGLQTTLQGKKLRTITVAECPGVTGEFLDQLVGLQVLQLIYEEAAIDRDSMRRLTKVTSLKTLSLFGCQFKDVEVGELVRLQALEHLDLRETSATQVQCEALAQGLKKLTSLRIPSALDSEAIQSLRPDLEIEP